FTRQIGGRPAFPDAAAKKLSRFFGLVGIYRAGKDAVRSVEGQLQRAQCKARGFVARAERSMPKREARCAQAALAFFYEAGDGNGRSRTAPATAKPGGQPSASKFSLTLDRSSGAFFVVAACAPAAAPAAGLAALLSSQWRLVGESEFAIASST